MHYVYVVRCADGTLYTGYARDPNARVKMHNDGRGAKYTRGRRPVTLVYVERLRTKGKALSREYRLKQLRRSDKERLIASARTNRRKTPERLARRTLLSIRSLVRRA